MNKLVREDIMVELVELGEGIDGDYQPDDPEDIELLRFDVSILDNGKWVAIDDASYCTQIPVSATYDQRFQAVCWIMEEVYELAHNRQSIKKICELLSWLSLRALKDGELTPGMWVLS